MLQKIRIDNYVGVKYFENKAHVWDMQLNKMLEFL